MTAVRRLWRTRLIPTGRELSHPSRKAAYEHVGEWARATQPGGIAWANGEDVTGIVVLCDERQGRGPQVVERVDFADWPLTP